MRLLAVCEAFVGVSAMAGGAALVSGAVDPGVELVRGSVFSGYRVPGLILLVAVGGSALIAAWTTWRSTSHAALFTTIAGVIMSHWIVTEWAVVGFHWLQVPYLIIGIAMASIGWRLRTSPE